MKTGSTWGTPVTLSSLGSFGGGTGNIAVAPDGDVLASWSFRTTKTYIPNEAQSAFFSGCHWGGTMTISTNVYGNASSFDVPSIGVDGHSQATLVWEEITNPSPIACALKPVTGKAASGFGTAQTISNAATCYGWNNLAVNSGGQAVALEGAAGILSAAVVTVSRDLTGGWGAPVTTGASGVYRQRQPKPGLGNDGTAVVVWLTNGSVRYAVRSGGSWITALALPGIAGTAGGLAGIAAYGSGNAVAISEQVSISPGELCDKPAGWWVLAGQGPTELQHPGSSHTGRNVRGRRNHSVDSTSRNLELDHSHRFQRCDHERCTGTSHRPGRASGQRFNSGRSVVGRRAPENPQPRALCLLRNQLHHRAVAPSILLAR